MRNNLPIALLALAGALGLWWWSRTEEGEDMIRRASDAAGEGITQAGEAVQRVIDMTLPRGLRNNNPGNIDRKAGTTWRGMSADQSADGRFVVFDAPEWGIRAIARVLRSYQGRGLRTIQQIISTWAPPTENDTAAYVAQVSRATGYAANLPITDAQLPGIIEAIIRHENGQQPYPAELIARGIELERSA